MISSRLHFPIAATELLLWGEAILCRAGGRGEVILMLGQPSETPSPWRHTLLSQGWHHCVYLRHLISHAAWRAAGWSGELILNNGPHVVDKPQAIFEWRWYMNWMQWSRFKVCMWCKKQKFHNTIQISQRARYWGSKKEWRKKDSRKSVLKGGDVSPGLQQCAAVHKA